MPVNISGNGLFTGASSINGLTLPTDSFSPGLVKITDQMFSAVSSVSVNNCFSSIYDNYLIILYASGTPDAGNINIRFRSSGSDNTNSTYSVQRITADGTSLAGIRATTTSIMIGGLDNDDDANALTLTVVRPFLATRTTVLSQSFMPYAGGYQMLSTGYFDNTDIFDGFTLFPNSGTMTGTFRVYGYRN